MQANHLPAHIQSIEKGQLPELNRLISDAFGYTPPHSFFDDFPIWASDQVERLGIMDQGKLVSHAGIRYVQLQTSHGLVPAAFIGGVATHPNHRGKGFSSTLLKALIEKAATHPSKPKWLCLWGSEHEFYRKLGFELEGKQALTRLGDLEGLQAQVFPEIKSGFTDRIFDSLLKQKEGVKFHEADRDWVSKHKTVDWLYIEKPFAFLAYGRGLDLKEMIHEWGGDPVALRVLFSHVFALNPNALLLGRTANLERLGFLPEALIDEKLCLARPTETGAILPWDPEFWISGLSAC